MEVFGLQPILTSPRLTAALLYVANTYEWRVTETSDEMGKRLEAVAFVVAYYIDENVEDRQEKRH